MSRFPDSYYYASEQEDHSSYFYEDSAPSRKSCGEYYTDGQEVEPVFYEDTAPYNSSGSHYFAAGQGSDHSNFYEDSAPSQKPYSEYYADGQEVEPVFYEDTAPYNSSGSHYFAAGQGSDHSNFYEDSAPSQKSYSEYYTGGQEVEPVFYEDTAPYYPSCGLYYATGEGSNQSYFYKNSAPSQKSYSEYYTGGQEVESIFYEDTATNMTSYFKDDGIGLGIMYPDEEENEEECKFEPQASFCSVTDSTLASLPPLPVPAYYVHVHEYQNTDSTPKASSKPKAFSASDFRDDNLSLYCYHGQRKSVASSTVTQVNAVEAAQVAKISHVNELTPRDSGGSFTQHLKKAVNPKTYSKLFKRAGKKLRLLSKERLECW